MASWMVHLRIADRLLDKIPDLAPIEFIMGSIAPDSGVPNADGSAFTPCRAVSHFKEESYAEGPEVFTAKYFSQSQRQDYSSGTYGFYLGYLTHLMTDILWSNQILHPTLDKYAKEDAPDRKEFIRQIKEDWYDLDFKYLRDHPGFRAFRVYLGAVGFRNTFMEEFSPDAFDLRRQYITDFYLQGKDGLDREYPYLTEAEMDRFVRNAAEAILCQLSRDYAIFC